MVIPVSSGAPVHPPRGTQVTPTWDMRPSNCVTRDSELLYMLQQTSDIFSIALKNINFFLNAETHYFV